MDLFIGILIGLFVLVFLVVIHELGHAIVARRNGVVVEEFGIGFPPRAWGKKLKNGILFSLNWLPLGGFVKLQGEHDSAKKKGDYGAATFWQKTRILFAGVLVNWIAAVIIFSGLALVGIPKIVADQVSIPGDTTIISSPVLIGSIVEDLPADQAGIQEGDVIVSIDDRPVSVATDVTTIISENHGETVPVTYQRDGQDTTVDVPLRDGDGAAFGASFGQQEKIQATWSAPLVGIATSVQFTIVTFQGLGQLVGDVFSGLFSQLSTSEATREQGSESLDRASNSVAGPVGILGVIFPAAGAVGIEQVIFLAGIISLTLAVMNTLPIPALDGGRWFTMVLFRLLRKPLTKEREEVIQGTGFLFLMGLIILITVGDVTKLFS